MLNKSKSSVIWQLHGELIARCLFSSCAEMPSPEYPNTDKPVEEGRFRSLILYVWENDEHAADVRKFCMALRNKGIDARLDQFERRCVNVLGCRAWKEEQYEEAKFVLVVCSKNYKEAAKGKWEPSSDTPLRHRHPLRVLAADHEGSLRYQQRALCDSHPLRRLRWAQLLFGCSDIDAGRSAVPLAPEGGGYHLATKRGRRSTRRLPSRSLPSLSRKWTRTRGL